METKGKVSLKEAIVASMMANRCTDADKGMEHFTEMQTEIGKAVVHYSLVICSRDQEVEICGFRQLAKSALEMSVMVERGFTINEIMKKAIEESNVVNRKMAKECIDKGENVAITTLGQAKDNTIETKTITTNAKEIKEKIYDA